MHLFLVLERVVPPLPHFLLEALCREPIRRRFRALGGQILRQLLQLLGKLPGLPLRLRLLHAPLFARELLLFPPRRELPNQMLALFTHELRAGGGVCSIPIISSILHSLMGKT